MANNPLDELVQSSLNPADNQQGLASSGEIKPSSVSSSNQNIPATPQANPPTVSSSSLSDNPLDHLIAEPASPSTNPAIENTPSSLVSSEPGNTNSAHELNAPRMEPVNPLQSPSPEKSDTSINPLDTLMSQSAAQIPLKQSPTPPSMIKGPTQIGALGDELVESPTSLNPLSSLGGAAITQKPIPAPKANESLSMPGVAEHDISVTPQVVPASMPSVSVPKPFTPPAMTPQPIPAASISPDKASTLSQKELEEKAKKLLKESPPKGKSNKKPWILGLLTLLVVIGAAGGGLFAYRIVNPDSTEQRSQAAGICCLGGECNDGTTFGGDPSAWHSSCDVRAEEFCNEAGQNRGGVKRSDGACTGTEPNTCNDNTPADSCWVFVCPNGCGGDGNETSCDGQEPGAVKRIVDCDSAQLGNRECGQIDYAKNGQYCGVKLVQCGTDCNPNPTNQPSPTAQPSPTPPGPTQPITPTATGNLTCTPNQTLGNLSYDIKLTNISPVVGFQQSNFQLCIYPSSNAGHKHLFQNLFNSNASYKDQNLVNGVPTWACYQIGPVVTQLSNTNQITHVFNRAKKLGNTATWAKTIDEFAAFMDAESAAGRINRMLQWQIKAVLQANGQKNDQFVVGTVIIHSNACIGPLPSPTPSPTPHPSAPPLACISLSKTPSTVTLGSAVTFTCQSEPNAVKYDFRYKVDNGNYSNLLPDGPNISSTNLMITQAGSYRVECRACKDQSGTNCTNWGLAR